MEAIAGNFSTFFRQSIISYLQKELQQTPGSLTYFGINTTSCGNAQTNSIYNEDTRYLYRWQRQPNAAKSIIPKDINLLKPWLEHFSLVNNNIKINEEYKFPKTLYIPGPGSIVLGSLRNDDRAYFLEIEENSTDHIRILSKNKNNIYIINNNELCDEYFINFFPTRTAKTLVHIDLGNNPTYLQQMNVYNTIFSVLKYAPDSIILCTYPIPYGRLPYRLFEAFNYTGYKTAYNASFYADYSLRSLRPFSYSQLINDCTKSISNSIRVHVTEIQLIIRNIQEFEYLLQILRIKVAKKDTATIQDNNNIKDYTTQLNELENKIQQLRQDAHNKYQDFIIKYNSYLQFSPYISKDRDIDNTIISSSQIDEPEYILSLGHLKPKDDWDGVGAIIYNGPMYIDHIIKSIGETLQTLCDLPSGYSHKRVGSIHEPIGGPKEYDLSYKYQDYRRTDVTFDPYHRTLNPEQLTHILLKQWKRKASKFLYDIPLYSGPNTIQGCIDELMQDGATSHTVQLCDVSDPYNTMRTRDIQKILHDPLFDNNIRQNIRSMRYNNLIMAQEILKDPSLLNDIEKLMRQKY